MPIVRSYPIGEVSPQPLPDVAPSMPAAGDVALFGGDRARDLQVAGQQLGQASESLAALYERTARDANDNRVQDLNNQFLDGRREILRTGPDAYYSRKGAAAIAGADAASGRLTALKDRLLDQTGNGYQRQRLGRILGLHLAASAEGIADHVAAQQDVYNRGVAAAAIRTAQAEATADPSVMAQATMRAEDAARVVHAGQPPEAVEAGVRAAAGSLVAGVIGDRLAHNDVEGVRLLRQHGARLDPAARGMLGAAAEMVSNSVAADAWLRERSATLGAPMSTGDATLDAVNAASAPTAEPPPVVSSGGALLDPDGGIVGTRRRLADIEERHRALTALNDQEFAANPARRRANQVAIDTDTSRRNAAEKADADTVYADLRRHLTTGGPDGGPAVTPPPATIMSRLTDAQQDAVSAQVNDAIKGHETETDPQTWYAIRQGLTGSDAGERRRWASASLVPFMGRLSPEDYAELEKQQAVVRGNGAGQRGLQAITRMADEALRSIGIDPAPRPDAAASRDAVQAAMFHRAVQDELSAFESKGGVPNEAEAYAIVDGLKNTGIKSGWLKVSAPTVMTDFPSTDEAFHEDGAQTAQAEPGEPRPGRWMTLDFNRMRRMREEEEQAAAGTGGAPGAPAIEPDPGSPEYQAADAVARRIAGENTPAAGRAETARPSVARDASMAVPAAPALAPAGAVLGEIGQAAWEAAKKGAGLLVRVAPVAAGAAAAAPIILLPGNSGAELHPMGEDLRVRTAPGQRTATVQRRVSDGFLGTGIGEKWVDLPVDAEWASDEQTGRRYIAIDRRGLGQAIGRDAADAAFGSGGIAMAKPPSNGGPDKGDRPGPGHNSEPFGEKLTPEPRDEDPKPPLNPAPLVLPAVEGTEKPRIIEGEDIELPLATEAGDGSRSYGAFKWKYKSAGPGYEWHHIVGQTPANVERFGAATIHNTNNIARLPKWLHDKVSHFYSTKQSYSGELTVRKWQETKSFEEQAAYGRSVIERFLKEGK